MKKSIEDVKKQAIEKEEELKEFRALQSNNKKNAQEQERYNLLLNRHRHEILKRPDTLNEMKQDEEVEYEVNNEQLTDLEKLITNYETQTGRKIESEDGKTVFSFPDKEKAIEFFEGQAKQGIAFEVYNKKLNHCIYSDGKNFVQGTVEDVKAYKQNPHNYEIGEQGVLTKKDLLQHNM